MELLQEQNKAQMDKLIAVIKSLKHLKQLPPRPPPSPPFFQKSK